MHGTCCFSVIRGLLDLFDGPLKTCQETLFPTFDGSGLNTAGHGSRLADELYDHDKNLLDSLRAIPGPIAPACTLSSSKRSGKSRTGQDSI